jgi:3-isopropylmalate/(R)-2-methylmalate dehydratase large subunit
MGRSMIQKILSDKVGRPVHVGELIEIRPDVIMTNELSAVNVIDELEKHGLDTVADPDRCVVVFDHFTPAKDLQTAAILKRCREFARRHAIAVYEGGRGGIEHVVLPEEGWVGPGQVILGGDSHTPTYGALGAVGLGMGATDIAYAMATGQTWLRVPPSIRVRYEGKPRPGVHGKDIILATLGKLTMDGATYQAVDFCGDGVQHLTMADRFTIANMSAEAGAKTGMFAPDQSTLEFIAASGFQGARLYTMDDDAEYTTTYTIDLSALEPYVALPGQPDQACPISAAPGVKVDQVIIGTCTNGRIEDLRQAAAVLHGRQVHVDVRCLVIPGSQKVYAQALREGLLQVFADAGVVVAPPGCGPCMGGHMGILADAEVCVSTTNRNFPGRMGHRTAQIYLAGPMVSAASAVAGFLVDPKEVLAQL